MNMKPQHTIIAAIGAFLVAAAHFSGLVLRDMVPRLAIGAIWSLTAAAGHPAAAMPGVGLFRVYCPHHPNNAVICEGIACTESL